MKTSAALTIILFANFTALGQDLKQEYSQAELAYEMQKIEKELFKYGKYPWFYSQGQVERKFTPQEDPATNWYKGYLEIERGIYKRYKN